ADRELLARWLQPLGFEVLLATSGHDALALLATMDRLPDAIFMDLAMPGIDGWETLRRLRARGWGNVPLAIVSANAFDKGLQSEIDGDRGHSPQDFFVKPVRRDDLLVWLGQRLGLTWQTVAKVVPDADELAVRNGEAAPLVHGEIAPLLELVRLGYYKGIVQWLDDWVRLRPEQAEFARGLRTLAREFRFEAIEQRLLGQGPSAQSSGVS
ncbi:MAG: response regulator, partial [Hydrogenophaga sp.]|nr:response regulator [Hydrogenophaga sp.]